MDTQFNLLSWDFWFKDQVSASQIKPSIKYSRTVCVRAHARVFICYQPKYWRSSAADTNMSHVNIKAGCSGLKKISDFSFSFVS